MIRPPPTSTLFPYTTLFRSSIQNGLTGDPSLLTVKSVLDGFTAIALAATLGWGVLLTIPLILLYQDRKSTRLNSSHVKISYAVFCLKKKKIQAIKSQGFKVQ